MLIFLFQWVLEKYQMFIVLIVLHCTAQRGVDSRGVEKPKLKAKS